MPDLSSSQQSLAAAVGHDIGLLIGRVGRLERNTAANTAPALPVLPLPGLLPIAPNAQSPGTGSANPTMGFTDLALMSAGWSSWDLGWDGQDIVSDSTLDTAILISVWTYARADGKNGWWGDAYNDRPVAGSLLWTLMGKPATPENVGKGIGYVQDALQWLLDDGWLQTLAVSGDAQDSDTGAKIFAFRLDGTTSTGQPLVLYL